MAARGDAVAIWWVDRYTRGLPPEVRDRRRAEIASDVHEQLCATDGRTATVAFRTLCGVHADLAWRREERCLMQASHRPTRRRATWGVLTQNWFAPLAVLVAVFDLLLVINAVAGGESVEPGDVVLAFVLVGLAASVLGGLWLREHAASAAALARTTARREPRVGGMLALVGLLAVVAACMMVGISGGSIVPYFVGMALLAVAVVGLGARLVVRAVRASDPRARGALADAMIIVGALPALGFWWAIVPTVVALAVIVGVLTTTPRIRTAV